MGAPLPLRRTVANVATQLRTSLPTYWSGFRFGPLRALATAGMVDGLLGWMLAIYLAYPVLASPLLVAGGLNAFFGQHLVQGAHRRFRLGARGEESPGAIDLSLVEPQMLEPEGVDGLPDLSNG